MKPILFIDQDGTLIEEVPVTWQIDEWSKLKFMKGALNNLSKIVQERDFELVLVSNQDGLGRPQFPEEPFMSIHQHILDTFSSVGVNFSGVHIDKSLPEENKPTRKPGTAMLGQYTLGTYDLANSYVIGDRVTDMQLAQNLGCKGLFLNTGTGFSELGDELAWMEKSEAISIVSSWEDIYRILTEKQERIAEVSRVTKETDISVKLNLDGAASGGIDTGIGFFDHMLDQISRHGQVGLSLICKGDLHIDEHHSIEDCALALGAAFKKALGDKRGIERYGFALPMDDCTAQVLIDFGGRPSFIWEAEFKREMVGQMPTEMFSHFFKSFSDAASCNLVVKAKGENEHHKIEAIFKAFAKAIKMAKSYSGDANTLPSTKGML